MAWFQKSGNIQMGEVRQFTADGGGLPPYPQ